MSFPSTILINEKATYFKGAYRDYVEDNDSI